MSSPLVLLISASFLSNVLCKPSFIENDSIVFPEDNTTSSVDISDRLNQCLQEDMIEFNGECKALLTTTGVCLENQWLVLDLVPATQVKPKIVGKCVQRRCPSSQHFWVEEKRCVSKNESSSLCPVGNEIDTDKFGDGFCRCINDPVHGKHRDGVCYPLYKRGPCPADRVLIQSNERTECRADNCENTRNRFPNKTIVPWKDGRCYAVEERGPCKQGHTVLVTPWNPDPQCGDSLTTLNLLGAPCSGTDHSGQCRPPIKTPQNHFLSQVVEQASKKRNKKSSNNPK